MSDIAQDLGGVVLLPCPFCGGDPIMWAATDCKDGFVHGTTINCQSCGISINDEYQDAAIADWNTRTHSAEIAGALAAQTTERRALLWLAGRDSGLSSQAIAYHMLGLPSNGNYPLDPSDLGRCLRMLELFPEWKPRISEMASYSRCWAGLCTSWDALAAMMADEVGIDWSKGRNAPKTYQAMQTAMQQGGGGGE